MLALGLATIPVSAQHLDGHEMVKFMGWAQGIFTLRPGAADLLTDVHWVFKIHIVLGLTILGGCLGMDAYARAGSGAAGTPTTRTSSGSVSLSPTCR